MDLATLEHFRSALDEFCGEFDDCIKTKPSRRHLRTYLAGQLGPLPRKSVEPLALEAGVPPRTLQEFLSLHRWEEGRVASRVRQLVVSRHADPEAVAVVDETGCSKKGEHTVGVQRQYCGETGKTDNCVVTVHLGYATDDFHALVDSDVYLPESWASDRELRAEVGVPDQVVFRPKWKIALDLLRRTMAEGVGFKYLTADEGYGCCGEFRREVARMGLFYVVEVPRKLTGWTVSRRRRGGQAKRLDQLWERGGPSWETYHVKDTEKGPVVWEARASRFRPHQGADAGDECWLVVARNVVTGEVKYFFSNLPADAAIEEVLRVAFTRWHVERCFEEAKGEIGLGHFEVRKWKALLRHLILSAASLLFLNEQVKRMRWEKPLVDSLPGKGRRRGAA
jgi:SRSO17 transposase